MKPKSVRHVAGGEQKSNYDLIATNRSGIGGVRQRPEDAAVIESNIMASATLTAINAHPAVSRSPARRCLEAKAMQAASNRQSPRNAKPRQGQGLRPEPERVGQSLGALGRQRRQPELWRQAGVEERADK